MRDEPPSGAVRLSIVWLIADALHAAGTRGQALLQRHGVNSFHRGDLYGILPLPRYIALFEAAAAILNDPALGVKLGRSVSPAALGPLGMVVIGQPDLRRALEVLAARIPTLQSGTTVRLSEEQDLAIFNYRLVSERIWPRRQDAEFAIVATCSIIRALVGAAWRPLDVHFEHSRGLSARALEAYIGVAPRYGEVSNRIIFPREDLDRETDPAARSGNAAHSLRFLEWHLNELMLDAGPSGIVGKVEAVLDRRLGPQTPTLEIVALDLGLSTRTLQRELTAHRTSYGEMLRQCRLKRARILLEQGELPLDEIAGELGYADATAFIRAFRQWTGSTPRRSVAPRRL